MEAFADNPTTLDKWDAIPWKRVKLITDLLILVLN